jgi:hypothetical protein
MFAVDDIRSPNNGVLEVEPTTRFFVRGQAYRARARTEYDHHPRRRVETTAATAVATLTTPGAGDTALSTIDRRPESLYARPGIAR